ncbi:MAG TPA: tRNA (N6-isopentenyl adenosine(37)-C2)-methylthiotransferase MiaB [Peptococcaceae bacterium]|nr:tRNA (N6-isopentenyl adenosine(37)-C2)-methylthiotransferase MiaB [Peptococcaceae bacterium]
MHIVTWGCQMNEHDSEIIHALLEKEGYQWTDQIENADLIVLNTCCVRKSAEQKALGFLGNLKRLKKKKPDLVIAVGGCMPQNPEIREYLQKKTPFVNVVFGTRSFHYLPELLKKSLQTNTQVVDTELEKKQLPGILPARHSHPVKAYVTIIYGCDNFCSYCIVPYTRGREKSRPLSDICEEVRDLVRQGYKEIMLLGQNVNDYGKDLQGEVNFATLLQLLDETEGLLRIRYMTSHPRNFSDEIIETIAASKKVCEHFHLPLQAGSNKVLKLMNRGYTREDYLQKVEKIRKLIPGASITTDLIVGFPGETEEDFEDTLDMVQRVRFDAAYTFMFSPRTGTPAAEMPDQVPLEEKKRRLAQLIEVQKQISLEVNQKLRGQTWEILVEGRSKNNPQRWSGRTRTNKVVVFQGNGNDLTGKLVDVQIEAPQSWYLLGSLKKIREKKEESLPLPRSY